MTLAARLHRDLVAAGCVITGVSIGRRDDRSTWKVRPSDQQAIAQAVIDAFDESEAATALASAQEAAQAMKDKMASGDPVLKALADALKIEFEKDKT